MHIIGYIASIFIGIALGFIGGGGTILTVPVLVYIFSLDAVIATSYSLFIVGSTSTVAVFSQLRNGHVHFKSAIAFGVPSILAVFITRLFLLPLIPETLQFPYFSISKSLFLLLIFALLMIASAYRMIQPAVPDNPPNTGTTFNALPVLLQGFMVGTVTGLVGAGGGFLIVPALVLLTKVPIKQAIGTSLLIISVNSVIGFASFISVFPISDIQWQLLFSISALSIIGMFIGMALSKNIDGSRLKPVFGWFVLIMGVYILVRETVVKMYL